MWVVPRDKPRQAELGHPGLRTEKPRQHLEVVQAGGDGGLVRRRRDAAGGRDVRHVQPPGHKRRRVHGFCARGRREGGDREDAQLHAFRVFARNTALEALVLGNE